ncbi:hypothetical protein DICPUDRAFT_97307 [Dictyostelium purpureum]|uniref:Alpha/beta hydrolase fold-3 domain-containing protein n=1 Tax=Dictyostelium purpureum TaxID=5786 RepID=F0ZFK0_DICPU|nr:uncharacterized protein DICPUDRAFT_97307 [Dictyostelium purpureum]EGC37310.1 hypothetical protein DICPUDRAFT_97307 [Dictyostelium purpureum]|eukprot:XP_003286198.1 hypothetical protein DICPUDRAFT_97307 [Dictyostelium purpureum]
MSFNNFSLEKEAADVCNNTCKPPFLYELEPEEGRKAVDKVQDAPCYMYPCRVEERMFELVKELGMVKTFILTPEKKTTDKLPIVFYIHGAGWVFGGLHSHKKLVQEICNRTNSVVIFPEYSLSPEVKYPIAIEQCYAVLVKVCREMADKEGWDTNNIVIAGDSAGGNMATVLTMMAKKRNNYPIIKRQVLYYPGIDARMDTGSYKEFAKDFYLSKDGMKWFWDAYLNSDEDKNEILASPARATPDDVKGLPEAIIMNGEADVLRDEGEQYARTLRAAGVPVTHILFQGMIHDFVMLNSLDSTKACRAAMDVSIDFINKSRETPQKPKQ